DSTVVSHLVRRALGKAEVLHIFSDTTLEDPLTYSYVKRFRRSCPTTPFFIPKSEHDFFSLCDEMGPPTQHNRWCCTIFKTSPISNVLNSFGKDILTFYGVRHAESNARSGYEQISHSQKITKQIVASPIIGWGEIDVWLYILGNHLDYNNAYDFGFSRVGCWLCPLNSDWSNFLTQLYLPDKFNQWRQLLIDFAIKLGKLHPQEYVDQRKWALRYGGIGKEAGGIRFKSRPCGDSEYARSNGRLRLTAKSFRLDSPLTEKIREYFKPFGRTTMFVNKYGLLTIQVWPKKWEYEEPQITLEGRLGSNDLKIILKRPKNYHLLYSHIEMQLSKFLTCSACGGCSAVCPNNAIITAGGDYRIDEEKCTGCGICVSEWNRGCLVADTLRTY
ncbi:MAG: phosphoadenosine phosphosulfate reductase family protein, partial [Candidatus Poribacteria bacterium]